MFFEHLQYDFQDEGKTIIKLQHYLNMHFTKILIKFSNKYRKNANVDLTIYLAQFIILEMK